MAASSSPDPTTARSIRRRIIWVLLGLTVASASRSRPGVSSDSLSLAREENGTGEVQIFIGVSQILVLVAFMFGFVLAMTAFLGAPAIATGVESRVAHAMLAGRSGGQTSSSAAGSGCRSSSWRTPGGLGPARDRHVPPRERLRATRSARGRRLSGRQAIAS